MNECVGSCVCVCGGVGGDWMLWMEEWGRGMEEGGQVDELIDPENL